jgi:hypothetical protein
MLMEPFRIRFQFLLQIALRHMIIPFDYRDSFSQPKHIRDAPAPRTHTENLYRMKSAMHSHEQQYA